MLYITEFQKFMFIYKKVMKYGVEVISSGQSGFKFNEITAIPITDNNLGMILRTEDLVVTLNTNKNVEMITYYVGSEKELTYLVKKLETVEFWSKNINLKMLKEVL